MVSKNGIVTAKRTGLVTIKAISEKRNYRCNLTVTNPILSSSKLYKTIGDLVQLSIQQSDGKVRWQSENPAVATVNSSGKVTTRGCGKTKIRATVDGKSRRGIVSCLLF